MTTARVLGLAACLASTSAFALEQGETLINGFGTVGVTHLGGDSDSQGYGINGQTTDSWRGDQLSKFGIQMNYGVTDTVGLTLQTTAKAYGDEWKANLEWAYLSWQANDSLMTRVGRLRAPAYMYSESLDVGFSYPWLRLPEEVYSQVQLTNYEGADAVYTLPLSYGSVAFHVAGGMAKNRDTHSLDDMHDIDYNDLFGANVSLATNDFGTFRVGYVEADIKADIADVVSHPLLGITEYHFNTVDHQKGKFSSVGYQYDNGTWLTSNEWSSRSIEADNIGSVDSFYLMGGRRFGDFLAHVTYGQLDEDSGRQNSWTYGLNYNLAPTVVLKGEYKRVDTTGGNERGVSVRNAQQTLDRALGLAPANNFDGDIISAGVDFVF